MNYLKYSEIFENSFIMIEFEDGTKEPYFVDQIRKGRISGVTMLLGHKLSELISNPKLYPCSRTGGTDRFYIPNEETEGHHEGVLGYRQLEQKEKNEWQEKLKLVRKLFPLYQALLAS
jgi:hypothetical protein